VYQEGRIIAKQEGAPTQWDVRDPANNSNFMLDASGASVSHVELDPLGTTVDPNNPSYSQNPMGFYGGPGLQGTYCRVNNLGISVPCSLADMLNSHNFNQMVTVNGEEMPLSMAQGLADIGWINQNDIIFGNPWDLNNVLPRMTFRENVLGTYNWKGPVPPPSNRTLGPSSRDYFFNWGAFYAGYLWMGGLGTDSRAEHTSPGAFLRLPQNAGQQTPAQQEKSLNPSCSAFVDQLINQFYKSTTSSTFGYWMMNRARNNQRLVGDRTYNKAMPNGLDDPNGFKSELIQYGQSGDVYRHIMFVAGTLLNGESIVRSIFIGYDRRQAERGRQESVTELADDRAGERVGKLLNDYQKLGSGGLKLEIERELCR
jgi:hypothetical protein